jgi:hypothetical protein
LIHWLGYEPVLAAQNKVTQDQHSGLIVGPRP